MPLAGRQLTWDSALARCYEAGWRGKPLVQAVALMCAESGRYTQAYHVNFPGSTQESTDRGLFQINDKAHPDLPIEDAFKVHANVGFAHRLYMDSDKTFRAWAAFNSGAYERFLPDVQKYYDRGKWRKKVA